MRPKWMGPLEPAVDALAVIATGGVAPASNVEVLKPGVEPEPIVLDCVMRKLGELSHERQAAVKKLASQWLVLKRLGIAGLTCEELGQVIARLP